MKIKDTPIQKGLLLLVAITIVTLTIVRIQSPLNADSSDQLERAAASDNSRQVQQLVDRIRSTENPQAQTEAINELRLVLQAQMDRDIEKRERKVENIKQRLRTLEEGLNQRRIAQREILDQQLQQLLNQTTERKFPSLILTSNEKRSSEPGDRQLIDKLRSIGLGLKIYEAEHQGAHPLHLYDVASSLGGETKYQQLTGQNAILFVRMPDKTRTKMRQQAPTVTLVSGVAEPGTCITGLADGAVMQRRNGPKETLGEEIRRILEASQNRLTATIEFGKINWGRALGKTWIQDTLTDLGIEILETKTNSNRNTTLLLLQ